MLRSNIEIGDRLEISQSRECKLEKTYLSQVEKIISADEIVVHVPISYGQLVRLSMKEQYSMLFFTERGLTSFDAKIIGYSRECDLQFMTVRLLSEGERIQRREFFRFDCLLPIKFSLIGQAKKEEESDDVKFSDGVIKDIGGGGIRFASNESVEEKERLKCVIMLKDDCFVLIGKILYKQYYPESAYKYQYRAQFVGILASEQEKIVQYIFSEQRKLLQRNKG